MNREQQERLWKIAEKFNICRKSMSALGDETRQRIVLALLECDYKGVRLGELARKIQLSRPVVSHHLQVLRDGKLVNMRKEGTKNYFYIDSDESQWKILNELTILIYEEVQNISKII